MNLGYFAADTLGVTLYAVDSGLKANEVHTLRMGPWRLDMPVEVQSDLLGNTELGFWVTVMKKLRLYAIIKEKECWLFVLNEAKLKECGEKTGFVALSVKIRIQEIKPAIVAVFRWRDPEWQRIKFGSDSGYDEALK
jgi:hypothetical protein